MGPLLKSDIKRPIEAKDGVRTPSNMHGIATQDVITDACIARPQDIWPVESKRADVVSQNPSSRKLNAINELMALPAKGAVLSISEILSADSIEALSSSYRKKGVILRDTNETISQTKRDWKLGLRELELVLNLADFEWWREFGLHSQTIEVSGVKKQIVGIIHSKFTPSDYLKMLRESVNNSNVWLGEEGVKRFFLPDLGVTELPDHKLENWRVNIAVQGLFCGLISPLALSAIATGKLLSSDARISGEQLRLPPPLLFNMHEGIPVFLSLQLKDQLNKPYNSNQRRSAYQAEFLRAYKPKEEQSILVGAGHVADIEYFLTRGVREGQIVEIAHQDAELLTRDPEKFRADYDKFIKKQQRLGYVSVGIGCLPWLGWAALNILPRIF